MTHIRITYKNCSHRLWCVSNVSGNYWCV